MAGFISIVFFIAFIVFVYIAYHIISVFLKIMSGFSSVVIDDNSYWDDAGDGSGVNYVQMPDGSVRID